MELVAGQPVMVLTDTVSSKSSWPGLYTLSSCVLAWGRQSHDEAFTQNLLLPKGLPPNTIPLGIRVLVNECWEHRNRQSVVFFLCIPVLVSLSDHMLLFGINESVCLPGLHKWEH
jgi:hypothetical protein